jgi:hypothetical protein
MNRIYYIIQLDSLAYYTICVPTTEKQTSEFRRKDVIIIQSAEKVLGACHHSFFLPSVNFSFGAGCDEPAAEGLRESPGTADIGGLVASGEETDGSANDWPLLRGGLPADPVGTEGVMGAAPLLNSAQRGHLRFVSTSFQ